MSTYVRPLRPEQCRRCSLPKDFLGIVNGQHLMNEVGSLAGPGRTREVSIWSCKRCDRNGYR